MASTQTTTREKNQFLRAASSNSDSVIETNNHLHHQISMDKYFDTTLNIGPLKEQSNTNLSLSPDSNRGDICKLKKITFYLKTSIFTRQVSIDRDKLALGTIKQMAFAFLRDLYFDRQHSNGTYLGHYVIHHFNGNDDITNLYGRILLRKYDPDRESFERFNSVSDIQPNSYVDIALSENEPVYLLNKLIFGRKITLKKLQQFHLFRRQRLNLATRCAACKSSILFGPFGSFYECSCCHLNYCRECKKRSVSDNCLGLHDNIPKTQLDLGVQLDMIESDESKQEYWPGKLEWLKHLESVLSQATKASFRSKSKQRLNSRFHS